MKAVIIKGCPSCPFVEKTTGKDGVETLWCFYKRLFPVLIGPAEKIAEEQVADFCKLKDAKSVIIIKCKHCEYVDSYEIDQETINNQFGKVTCEKCKKEIFWNMKVGEKTEVFSFMK